MALDGPSPTRDGKSDMTMANVSFNGRFLAAHPTGVQRVAEEHLAAVSRLLDQDADLAQVLTPELICPRDATRPVKAPNIPRRTAGKFKSHLWEQMELPRLTRGTLLVNLCNLAPLASTHAITMVHDAQVFTSPGSYSRAFRTVYQFMLPQLGKRHHKILTVSEFSKQELVQWKVAPEDKIVVAHNGADHVLRANADPAILDRLGLSSKRYTLGLANVQVHKNLKVVLEAHARPDMADETLVLFGAAKREDFESRGISVPENVVFAGFVEDGEKRALLENALALVFPSTTEGFGLPPLEAMTLGTPAICAPCGALPEVCADAASYAAPGDPEAWAAKILMLAQEGDNSRANRSEAAKAQAALFTWDRSARTVADTIIAHLES